MISTANLGTAIAETTMQAAAAILRQRGKSSNDVDLDALTKAIRIEGKAAALRILDDGKALLDSGRSGWLITFMRTECFTAAGAAVDAVCGVAA